MSWQHSPHRRGALLVLSLRQSYLHQHHQNAIIAYCLCVDALEGATIQMNDDSECTLTNRISVSQHFFQDLILAFTRMLPHEHFSLCALIYESLAYQSNPDASYDRVI